MDEFCRFRLATERDIDAVISIMRRYYDEDGYTFIEAEARHAASRLIADENLGRLWVAEIESRVAGYMAVTLGFSLEYRGRDAFIDELVIAEEHRGKGLGREAMDVAEAWSRELGVKALHLEVEPHREQAQELYRRAGFENHDRHLMTKRLTDQGPAKAGSRLERAMPHDTRDCRKQHLARLIEFREPLPGISAALSAIPWDSDQELVTLDAGRLSAILDRYLSGELSAGDLEGWANLVECRDDIDYSTCARAIHALANPLLEGPITPALARQLLQTCRKN